MELLDHPYMSQAKLSQLFPDQVCIFVHGSFLLSIGLGADWVQEKRLSVFLSYIFTSIREKVERAVFLHPNCTLRLCKQQRLTIFISFAIMPFELNRIA